MKIELSNGVVLDLEQPCTQQNFADLVGISQPAVSQLVSRGVLLPEQTAQRWLDRYLTNLREQIVSRTTGNP